MRADRKSAVNGVTFRASLDRVAQHRNLALATLDSLLVEYSGIAQTRAAWLRKQRIDAIPAEFSAVLDHVVAFADPVISSRIANRGA
jgi:hypothetical protein